jgi:hypothetical protein
MRTVTEYDITDHGIDHEQYFQGDGVCNTRFTDCATGIGDTPAEALDDALESLAQQGWDVSNIPNNESTVGEDLNDEAHYYMTVKVL